MEKIQLTNEAESLLLRQFSDSPNLKAMLSSLVQPFQEALDTIEFLKNGLFIDLANGETLDTIGSIVNESRKDMSDVDYRPWLKVKILLNNNSGTADDIKRILTVLYDGTGKFELHESPGNLKVYLHEPPAFTNERVIRSIIRKAVPLGIKTKIQIGFLEPGSDDE